MAGSQDFADDPRNAKALVYLNGQLVPRAEAIVSIFDGGFAVGDGVWGLHPMREAVIASQSIDPQAVQALLLGPVPGGRPVWYQKQMTLHMLPGFGLDWMAGVRNAFFIRHPRAVLASYALKRASPSRVGWGLGAHMVSLGGALDRVRTAGSEARWAIAAAFAGVSR